MEEYSIHSLSELLAPDALRLLEASGEEVVKQIGIDVVRGAVLDVLSGKNLRDTTELLTRRRIAALNLATVHMFVSGLAQSSDFIQQLPYLATSLLQRKQLGKSERWLAQWVLGLTNKGVQNVLRDSNESLLIYRDRYIQVCDEVIAETEKIYGSLQGVISVDSGVKAEVNWLFLVYLLNTIGSQTLSIRGSEKSAYGKLFEKLILGALLHILGFRFTSPEYTEHLERIFWLSSRGDKRESDATLLYESGKGVRFDIGFIGRGNTEISLDKVTRFEQEIQKGRTVWYMATIIIVDRIGEKSRIEELAKKVDGTIVQMSASYWPQQVARILHRALGFEHELVHMKQTHIHDFLKEQLHHVPLEEFIRVS